MFVRPRRHRWLRWLGVVLGLGLLARAEISLQRHDTILFYGNSLVERLLEHGELEAWLQLAHAGKELRIRSVAWTGDEVGHQLRPDGYAEHLKGLLVRWPAQVVVLGFGGNEAFAGAAGLKEFRAHLDDQLREIARRHPTARLVLLAPLAAEPATAPDAAARNRDLAAYTAVLAEAAAARGAGWIDLFAASQEAYRSSPVPLTTYGLHPNAEGCRRLARFLAAQFVGGPALARVDASRVPEVARAVAEKAHRVEVLVRIKNAVLYFGQRRRPQEYGAELPRYHQLIEQADAVIQALVRDPAARFADFPPPSLPSLIDRAAGSSRTGKDAGDNRRGAMEAVIRRPRDQQAEFSVADGYALNLFASEAEFPELANPLQLAFDARGRLWVATMPSFPFTEPGLPYPDKIVILEDTDRDGKADRLKVFAEGFDALDGIAFHERGVLVSAQPRLWLLEDTDGDDRADRRTELLRGIDVADTHHGGMVSVDPRGDVIFCDGVFNRSQFETPFGVVRGADATTYRLNVASGRVEREWQTLTANSWKVAFDRYGTPFQRYGGGPVKDGLTQTWTPLGVYHRYDYGNVFNYAKGAGVTVVSSPNFPDEYQQALAAGLLLGKYGVTLTRTGIATGPHVEAGVFEVFTTRNPAFRPTDIEFGLDGAMYVADFCTVLIGQGPNPSRDNGWDREHGRIWRVVHTGRPLVRDWPRIEGAEVGELLELLRHPQDLVRQHARLELRKRGRSVVPAIDGWVAAQRGRADADQSALEALWVLQAAGEARPALLEQLLAAGDPRHRAAALAQVRLQYALLPAGKALLARAAADPHPRVQMAALNAVSHLRPVHPETEAALGGLHAHTGPVADMRATLSAGLKPLRQRSLPVLDIAPETRVVHWLGDSSPPAEPPGPARKGALPLVVNRTFTTYVDAKAPTAALLSVRHGFLDISVNGVLVFSMDNQLSPDQQVALDLQPGLNAIEIAFRKIRQPPPVHLYDPLGQPLAEARVPQSQEELNRFAAAWARDHAADQDALRVQAVPHQMQFSPAELRVAAGQTVRLVFENPDLMQHNLLILAPGTIEEVGDLADQMAAAADGLARQFIPASPHVLHATPLVEPRGRYELRFTAPARPGRYPYVCTFPGHWRMMRGVLLVE